MPGWLSDLSLRAKFVAATMLVGSVATAFATIGFLFYANSATRAGMVREMTALAQVLAENSGAALVFDDPAAATQTLSALRGRTDVVAGRVIDPKGETFARFGKMPDDEIAAAPVDQMVARFDDNGLWVRQPVWLDRTHGFAEDPQGGAECAAGDRRGHRAGLDHCRLRAVVDAAADAGPTDHASGGGHAAGQRRSGLRPSCGAAHQR